MNESENNTENTSTPTPESSAPPSTPEVTEASVEKTTEIIITPVSEATSSVEPASTDIVAEVGATEDIVEVPTEPTEETAATEVPVVATATAFLVKAKRWVLGRKYTIAAVVLVLVAILGLTYIMEEQGRIETGLFDGVSSILSAHKAVATVNGEKITESELQTSISQIAAGAEAQGMDISDPELQAQIRSQAVDMLVNTELLMQEASTRGIAVTDEEIEERIATLTTDVGGEEVLMERMAQFGIDDKTLRRDVRNELTIQALLEKVFAEKNGEITDEEVQTFYDNAGGVAAGLPPLAEVAEQIKAQISSTKEQEQVTSLIEELRGKATIEVK